MYNQRLSHLSSIPQYAWVVLDYLLFVRSTQNVLDHAPIDGHQKMPSQKTPRIFANDMGFAAICHCQSTAPFFVSAQNRIAWLLLRIFFRNCK